MSPFAQLWHHINLKRVGAPVEKKVKDFMRRIGIGMKICLIVLSVVLSVGCSKSTQAAKGYEAPAVEVVQGQQKDVPIFIEWSGKLEGLVSAGIKVQQIGHHL